jgi:uncharacterized membrane protein YcaP (DUF421 family)
MDPFAISFHDMFGLAVPPLEKILRAVIVYLFLLVGLRLAGKRQLAQLNAFDLVVLLSISNTVQNAIIGEDNTVLGGFIGAATLLAINYLFVRYAYTHPRFDKIFEGESEQLMEDGQVLQSNLQDQLITRNELESAAHRQGFRSLAEVSDAVLEPGGSITFFGKSPSSEEQRFKELVRRLDEMARDVAAVKESLARR